MSSSQDRVDRMEARIILLEKTLSRAYAVLLNPAECICYEESQSDACPMCDPMIVIRDEIRDVLGGTTVTPSEQIASERLALAHAQGVEQMRAKAIEALRPSYDFGVVGVLQSIRIITPAT